jgi:hypothetical protein
MRTSLCIGPRTDPRRHRARVDQSGRSDTCGGRGARGGDERSTGAVRLDPLAGHDRGGRPHLRQHPESSGEAGVLACCSLASATASDGLPVVGSPSVLHEIHLLDRRVPVDARRKPSRSHSTPRVPERRHGPKERRISRAAPHRGVQFLDRTKLPDRHQSDSNSKRCLSSSASARSLRRTVSFFMR